MFKGFWLPLWYFQTLFKRNYSQRILLWNGSQRCKFIILGNELIYSVKHEAKDQNWKSSVCWRSLSTTYLSIFPYTPMRQSLYKTNYQRQKITEAKSPNLTFVYIDDILSINNPHFPNWIPLIYPKKLR